MRGQASNGLGCPPEPQNMGVWAAFGLDPSGDDQAEVGGEDRGRSGDWCKDGRDRSLAFACCCCCPGFGGAGPLQATDCEGTGDEFAGIGMGLLSGTPL